jgi:hypothetical protein
MTIVFLQVDTFTFNFNDLKRLEPPIISRFFSLYTSHCTRIGKDYDRNFYTTPGIAIAHIITSITVVNDLELHPIDIEQVFHQADKLLEGVTDRYFIDPSPGRSEADKKDSV